MVDSLAMFRNGLTPDSKVECTPTLTVGESNDFIEQGGLVRFYVDGGTVRFEINRESADRSGLRISSRLLQLARIVSASSGRP